MSFTYKIRRDTAANWTSTNPTLLSGEQGYETDTGKMKVGNGTSAWTSLNYISSDVSASVTEIEGFTFLNTQPYGSSYLPGLAGGDSESFAIGFGALNNLANLRSPDSELNVHGIIGIGRAALFNLNELSYDPLVGSPGVVGTIGNIAIGREAGAAIDYGSYNVVIGDSALNNMVGDSYYHQNVVIGSYAMRHKPRAIRMVALGNNVGESFGATYDSDVTLVSSVYIGHGAGGDIHQKNESGLDPSFNICIGESAGQGIYGGIQNICIGVGAGVSGVNHRNLYDNNIIIGHGAGNYKVGGGNLDSDESNNLIVLGNGSNNRLIIPGIGLDTGLAVKGQTLVADSDGSGTVILNWEEKGNPFSQVKYDSDLLAISDRDSDLDARVTAVESSSITDWSAWDSDIPVTTTNGTPFNLKGTPTVDRYRYRYAGGGFVEVEIDFATQFGNDPFDYSRVLFTLPNSFSFDGSDIKPSTNGYVLKEDARGSLTFNAGYNGSDAVADWLIQPYGPNMTQFSIGERLSTSRNITTINMDGGNKWFSSFDFEMRFIFRFKAA